MGNPESSSSDQVDELPSVPRVRRNLTTAPASDKKAGRGATKANKLQRVSDSSRRPTRAKPRSRRLGKHALESVHSDEDENEDDEHSDDTRAKRAPRRTLQARKIVDDEDDDDEHSSAPAKVARKKPVYVKRQVQSDEDEEEEEEDMEDMEEDSSKSDSSSPDVLKKKRDVQEPSSDSKDEDEIMTAGGQAMKGAIHGRNDLLAQLEDDHDDSDDFNSDDLGEKQVEKKTERLTSRQRALQGENVDLEFTKLESPRSKKQEPAAEEWSHDEEVELKKQQKARLRQMIHEKRNKEKRAAMVDKVLRGVTSKRKKFTMASEARAASIGTRLSQNDAREGCIRFVSNCDGISLSIPIDEPAPMFLNGAITASYPRVYERDPRTGKRIIRADAGAA